jgi:hypothetical protein
MKYGFPFWEQYFQATAEDTDKSTGRIRDLDSYWQIRHSCVGVKVSVAMDYIVTEIPDEILDHHTMQHLYDIIVRLTAMDNVRCIL